MRSLALIMTSLINLALIGCALVSWLLPIAPPATPVSFEKPPITPIDLPRTDLGLLPERSFFRPQIVAPQSAPPSPPTSEGDDSSPVSPGMAIRLVGLMETSQGRVAFIQFGAARDLQRRIIGDPINDWTLSRIDPRSIEIRKGDEVKTIALDPGQQP